MSLANVLALLVVFVAMPLNWLVTFRLWRLARQNPELRVIRERAIQATFLAAVVTTFALLFVSNDQPVPLLGLEAARLVSRSATLAVGIFPAAYWLWLYR